MKLIIEARYSYPKNTISFSKPFKVAEETDKYYYCQRIGKNYYKKHENDVRIVLEGCWDNTVIWKTIVVDEEFYKTNNLMICDTLCLKSFFVINISPLP